ncbi:exported hypothetical protein [metagenome]|uniref:Uncharacterized protein n=1 Tax=metagenome TaxID=256318 RepID=A0A2P2C8I4_9ZZZZ
MDEQEGGVRRARWAAAAAAVTVVMVLGAAVVASRPSSEDGPRSVAPSTDCVADTDAPFGETGAADARWVRFCPLADEGSPRRVRHPQGVVTGPLAASVAESLWQTQEGRPTCRSDDPPTVLPTRLFRIEVGLADGRVAELTGDTGCSTRDVTLFSQLETTLLMAAVPEAGPNGAMPDPVGCPARFTTTATSADGASADQLVDTAESPWQSTVPLLPAPATAADVCAYRGDQPRRRLVDQWQVGSPVSEAIRAAATLGYADGQTDCALRPGATSYVVVLTDATGTARTLALDTTRCATLQAALGTPAADTYLGLATRGLVRMVARSRP